MKLKTNNALLIAFMIAFSLLGMGFLFFIGNSQLQEAFPSFQFFADSNTYIRTYRGDVDNFEGSYIKIDANYLGPLIVLNVFQGNNYLILLFNVCVFTYSVIQIARMLKLNALYIASLLLISPLTVSSLLSVNKEVFLFPFLAFALNSYLRKSLFFFFIALFFSLFVRWQLGIFYLVLIFIDNWRPVLFSRTKLLLVMLLAISLAYLAIQPLIEPILLYVQLSIDNYQEIGSGLFERILQIQNDGLYFLIFPIKAFHLLFGMGFKVDKIINPVELYNDFFVAGHCAATFVIFGVLTIKKKLTLRSDFLFACVVFLAFFCVTPVFAPRYLYFVFVLAVLVLAGAPFDLQKLKIQGRPKVPFRSPAKFI